MTEKMCCFRQHAGANRLVMLQPRPPTIIRDHWRCRGSSAKKALLAPAAFQAAPSSLPSSRTKQTCHLHPTLLTAPGPFRHTSTPAILRASLPLPPSGKQW
jgi:hypothetical protein